MCCPHLSSLVRSLWSGSRCVTHLPGATTSHQPLYFCENSPERLRNKSIIPNEQWQPAPGGKAALQQPSLCYPLRWTQGQGMEQLPGNSPFLIHWLVPISHTHLQSQKTSTLSFFFFNQEHNLQIQAILTSECGEVKACTCPTIFQSEILHQEQASGKIYRDRQNDAGFKPKNGLLFQGVKERH